MIQSLATVNRPCSLRSSPVAAVSLCCFLIILLNARHLLAMHDSYPLLAGVLRTYQTNACDTETIKLECEARTVVSIVVVQYGHPAQPHMCRNVVAARVHQHQQQQMMLNSDVMHNNVAVTDDDEDELMQADADPGTTGYKGRKGRFRFNKSPKSSNSSSSSGKLQQPKCFDADRLRYNFLRKVERTCRDQYRCNVTLTPANLDLKVDPCAEHVKYAEVAYKCRPKLFRNKIVCEGNSTRLFCTDPDDRLAIFSAFYGFQYEPNNMCLPPGAKPQSGDMLLSYHNQSDRCETAGATETVMKLCSGRRECTVTASAETFGVPKCPPTAKKPTSFHMKLVHTCLSKKVMKPSNKPKTTTAIPTITSTTTKTTTMMASAAKTSTTTTTIPPPTTTNITKSVDHLLEKVPSFSSPTSTVATTHLVDDGDNDDHYDHQENDSHKDHTSPKESLHNKNNNTDNHSIAQPSDDEKEPQLILMDAVGSSSNSSPVQSLGDDGQTNPHANCSELPASMHVIGFVSDWISAVGFIKKNKERLILYLLVSLFGSLVCFLAVLSTKLYRQKKRAKLRAAADRAPPVAPFDIIDFDEDDLDDLDGLPSGPGGSGGGGGGNRYPLETGTYLGPSHRQFSYHVPQETPSMSILAGDNSTTPPNSRPLLYSTLRKKPALKNTTTNTDPTNTGPLGTNTTTFGAPTVAANLLEPWNTTAGTTTTTSSNSRLLTHPQHYHPQHHHHQQQQQQFQSSSPPTIIDYGLTLPSSMMPLAQSAQGTVTSTVTGTLPRKGILSNVRNSTGSGILQNANTQTMISDQNCGNGNGAAGLMIFTSAGGTGTNNIVAFVDGNGVVTTGGGDSGRVDSVSAYVAGGYGDTEEAGGNFSTMRRVVPVLSTGAINSGGGGGGGGGGNATPFLISRFEERGLEMLELDQPAQQQHQQRQGHTEPKTLSTSLNNFFM